MIDTHTFLWFIRNSKEISSIAKRLIEDSRNSIRISIASLWELSIKTAQGKLVIDGGYQRVIHDVTVNSFEIEPITFEHTLAQNQLSFHHKDPFDRIIASQAIVEEIDLISADEIFDSYFAGTNVKRIW